MTDVAVGVDPGLTGAIAALDRYGNVVALLDLPTVKVTETRRELCGTQLQHMLNDLDPLEVVVERQSARPGEGAVSSFKTGRGFGLILGVCAGLQLRTDTVLPQTWRRLVGLPAGSDKGASLELARRLWPSHARWLDRVKDHGRAEALLIAEYARRMYWLREGPRRPPAER